MFQYLCILLYCKKQRPKMVNKFVEHKLPGYIKKGGLAPIVAL